MMCLYASDVARGVLPGPYDTANACRYARAVLVPEELLERPALDIDRAAAAIGAGMRAAGSARRAPHVGLSAVPAVRGLVIATEPAPGQVCSRLS